ncbi:MAG TPA: hypothetical protein VGO45_02445 [Bacteroidia bacterium]|nr:hypothetical protein [Bacteroidia bacterium]
MKAKAKTTPAAGKEKEKKGKDALPGYPVYPASEDIYSRNKEEKDLDPENNSRKKTPNDDPEGWNEKDFNDDMTAEDLDIPGNEMDEEENAPGSEDEENNYYSEADTK